MKHRFGFTVIELLVTISIISMLSSIVMVPVSNARIKARDSKRIQDIHQYSLALELYYNDHGHYPAIATPSCTEGYAAVSWAAGQIAECNGWEIFALALEPYFKSLPLDSINDFDYYYYYSGHDGTFDSNGIGVGGKKHGVYLLYTVLEDGDNPLRCEIKQYRDMGSIELPGNPPKESHFVPRKILFSIRKKSDTLPIIEHIYNSSQIYK